MKFGFSIPTLTGFLRATEKGADDTRRRFERSYDICQLAEKLGYDFATVGQHRFSQHSIDSPCPLVVLAALAAQTSELRLCASIVILPIHNPVEVAEQAATVDEISGGRLILGVGIGYREYEFEGSGVEYRSRAARLEEGVEVLRRAWREGPAGHRGRYYQIIDADVAPKPLQPFGPPIWCGALVMPAVLRAARISDCWITDNAQPSSMLAAQITEYRAEARKAGRAGAVAMTRKVGIARTRKQVGEEWLPKILEEFRVKLVRDHVHMEDKQFEQKLLSGRQLTLADFPPDQFIAGSPEDCIQRLKGCEKQADCQYVIADFGRAAHGTAYDRIREAVELFGREVIPAFR